jgi:chemotaxis protein methyltransferase CheR
MNWQRSKMRARRNEPPEAAAMANPLQEPLLEHFSKFVASQLGLSFPKSRWRELERGIRSAALAFGMKSAETCAEWLMAIPLQREQIEVLAGNLTIGETCFFREESVFAALGEKILPDLIRSRQSAGRRLCIWSAGCGAGEEPYSIAILLKRLLPDIAQWRITILGTDINPDFLKKASEGVFSDWSFRDAPPWLKGDYFRRVGDRRYEIAPAVREMVQYSYLNLAQEHLTQDFFPSARGDAMDLVLCRNVLTYFTPERAARAIRNLRAVMARQGWLVVGASEAGSQRFSGFAAVRLDDLTLYRKADSQPTAHLRAPLGREGGDPIEIAEDEEFHSGPSADLFADRLPTPFPFQKAKRKPAPPEAPSRAKPEDNGPASSRYSEALAFFDQSHYAEAAAKLPDDPSDPTWTAEEAGLRARICANLGDLEDAVQWSDKSLALDKLNAVLHHMHGTILQERGLDEEAAISFRRALYLDPDLIMANFALGGLDLRRKRFTSAHRHFANALALAVRYKDSDIIPYSDGLAAGALKAMVQSALSSDPSR